MLETSRSVSKACEVVIFICRPFKFPSSIASVFLVLGTVFGLRFLYYYLQSGDESEDIRYRLSSHGF